MSGDGYENPCLILYDNADYQVCARCKNGAVRIYLEDGVYCGWVESTADAAVEYAPGDASVVYPGSYTETDDFSLYCNVDKYWGIPDMRSAP